MEGSAEDFAALAGRRALVTGATGFIGARVTAALLEAGAEVTAFARRRGDARALARAGAAVASGDLRDRRALAEAMAGQEAVFNLAHDVRAGAEANLAAFEALLSACREAGVARLVHAGSAVVYDAWPGGRVSEEAPATCLDDSYRGVKTRMERRLEDLGREGALASVILQPTIVYGPGGTMWTDLPAERLLRGPVVLPDDPPGLCHAVFVDDVAQAALRAALTGGEGAERYIVTGPAPVAWPEFYEGCARILGRGRVELRPAADLAAPAPAAGEGSAGPSAAARLGAWARALAGREATDRLRRRAAAWAGRIAPAPVLPAPWELALYTARGECGSERAQARLGYRPAYDLARGLEATAPYLRARYGGL